MLGKSYNTSLVKSVGGAQFMDIELKDCEDLREAYQGRYEGDDSYLRRISDEVNVIKGEYEGFGTYLLRLSNEAKPRGDCSNKSFPKSIIAVSVASLAVAGIGLLTYFFKIKKKRHLQIRL
jgi:hypothetical protein